MVEPSEESYDFFVLGDSEGVSCFLSVINRVVEAGEVNEIGYYVGGLLGETGCVF